MWFEEPLCQIKLFHGMSLQQSGLRIFLLIICNISGDGVLVFIGEWSDRMLFFRDCSSGKNIDVGKRLM